MLVGYLGPKGSFTHDVATHSFPTSERIAYRTITDVIKAYENQEIDFAVVPVENSIEGSVHETLDYLFHQGTIQAVAEVVYPIKQQLLVAKKDRPIRTVYSHPQALAQGKAFLRAHYPDVAMEMTASTAYAARYVAEHPDLEIARLPLWRTSEYSLEVQARDIQEIEDNYTRFWILGAKEPAMSETLSPALQKISLALTLPNNLSGALYKGLSTFAWRGINLTKIESRPLKTALGEYFFIIDLLNEAPDLIQFAYQELDSLGIQTKVLGRYQVYTLKDNGMEKR
ncbi:prephenate dehydratase [Streptococcus sp. CP1998]|uniref:Prephenate dehydratase n=1 Tax=Streptococcus sp. CP1998 TaxID=3238303 RepID=A0AB39LD57_9STRE